MSIYTQHLSIEEIKKAKTRYYGQKGMAKRRGIDFKFSFEDWINWWIATGHYHERGVGKGKYVMSRYNDIGDYCIENVFCQTFVQNFLDGTANRQYKTTDEVRMKLSTSLKGRVSPTKGMRHTEETKAKIAAAAKIRWENKKR